MNIGVDAGCLSVEDERLKLGVYQMTLNLLRQLGKISARGGPASGWDKENEYWLYSFAPIEKKLLGQFGTRMKNVVAKPSFGWRHFGLPLSLLVKKPDVFLGPSQTLPFFSFCPSIVIVHDLTYEHFPESFPDLGRHLKRITRPAVNKAKKIIAVSNSTKKDLVKIYQVSSEKIRVIHEGYDSIFEVQDKKVIEVVKKKYQLKKDYFLYVGALKKTKNIPRIMAAFAEFLKKSKKDFLFVLVGSDFWLDKEIKKTVKAFSLKKRVVFAGYVPFGDLPGLYSGAQALVSASLYEGFGLTLLEAMACGCPVIAGKTASRNEVVGSAGILVDPRNEKEIARAMGQVVDNRNLRQKMINAGLKQSKLFSWGKFAQGVLEVINENCHC